MNINEVKQVKDMLRPEIVSFIYSNQNLIYSQESSIKEIKSLSDTRLYEIAYKIEKLINKENKNETISN